MEPEVDHLTWRQYSRAVNPALGDAVTQCIVLGLRCCPDLTSITVTECSISNDNIQALVSALETSDAPIDLNITDGNHISSRGYTTLFRCIGRFRNFSFFPYETEAVLTLSKALPNAKKMQLLNISYIEHSLDDSEDAVEQVRQQCQELEIDFNVVELDPEEYFG
jgi:hypothetical protein